MDSQRLYAVATVLAVVTFLGLAMFLRKAISDRSERRRRTIALLAGSVTVPLMLANVLSGTAGYPPGHPYARPEFWLPPTLFLMTVGILMLVVALWPRPRH
jgi:cytochrome bd-type quinol oxidase subunit 2